MSLSETKTPSRNHSASSSPTTTISPKKALSGIPSPEKSAHKLLEIFVEGFSARPGETHAKTCLESNCLANGLSHDGFVVGLEFAISQGWIVKAKKHALRLTQAGFEAGGAIILDPEVNAESLLVSMVYDFGFNSEDGLPEICFHRVWDLRGRHPDDYEPAFQKAVDNGWLEVRARSESMGGHVDRGFLTTSGINRANVCVESTC